MKLNDARDIRLGEQPVNEVYLGEELIWSRKQPATYTPLAAIFCGRSDNCSVISDYVPVENTRIVMECRIQEQWGGVYSACEFFGCRQNAMGTNFGWYVQCYTGTGELDLFLQPPGAAVAPVRSSQKLPVEKRFVLTAQGNSVTITYPDGGTGFTLTDPNHTLQTTTYPIGVFGSHYQDDTNEWGITAGPFYLYDVMIYEGDTLVRHFVPVLHDQTQEAGLFDTVQQKFFGNVGTKPITPVYEA